MGKKNIRTLAYVQFLLYLCTLKQQSQVISLKCQPERIDELKAQYDCIGNPYNESPKHWIGLDPHSSPDALTKDLIRNSYEIVKAKYSKKR